METHIQHFWIITPACLAGIALTAYKWPIPNSNSNCTRFMFLRLRIEMWTACICWANFTTAVRDDNPQLCMIPIEHVSSPNSGVAYSTKTRQAKDSFCELYIVILKTFPRIATGQTMSDINRTMPKQREIKGISFILPRNNRLKLNSIQVHFQIKGGVQCPTNICGIFRMEIARSEGSSFAHFLSDDDSECAGTINRMRQWSTTSILILSPTRSGIPQKSPTKNTMPNLESTQGHLTVAVIVYQYAGLSRNLIISQSRLVPVWRAM